MPRKELRRLLSPPALTAGGPMQHLNQIDLATRWRMSARTLERWRWQRIGPPFIKAGGRVLYRLGDILRYEEAHLRQGR